MAAARTDSHLERILGSVDDLDEMNLAVLVKRLVRERAVLEAVFNTIREGILVIDRAGTIAYANQAALRLVGITEDDLGKAVLWKWVPDLARTLNLQFDSLGNDDPVLTREIEITYPERIFVRLYLVPMSEHGATEDTVQRPDEFLLIISDITEEKTSHEERVESERLSSIFMLAAGVAHEIGNPLNSIHIHLQLVERQLAKLKQDKAARKIADSVDVCASEVSRLDGIITNFLQAVRPRTPDFKDLNLLLTLEDVLAVQADEMENLGIEVEVKLDGDLPIIQADENQLKQVFFNLFKNATEAMDTGGALNINTRSDDQFVYVYIADTGAGISAEDLSKVFQPYFTTKEDGHGLGMMIVQRIMRDHGGHIGIDSRPGTGTIVTLQFPQKHRRMRMLGQVDD